MNCDRKRRSLGVSCLAILPAFPSLLSPRADGRDFPFLLSSSQLVTIPELCIGTPDSWSRLRLELRSPGSPRVAFKLQGCSQRQRRRHDGTIDLILFYLSALFQIGMQDRHHSSLCRRKVRWRCTSSWRRLSKVQLSYSSCAGTHSKRHLDFPVQTRGRKTLGWGKKAGDMSRGKKGGGAGAAIKREPAAETQKFSTCGPGRATLRRSRRSPSAVSSCSRVAERERVGTG